MADAAMTETEYQEAIALHRQGHAEAAERAYERILLADPAHIGALIHFGSLRLGQGRAAEAETLLGRAVAAAPDAPEAEANLAAALQALGRHQEAVLHFERALALRPEMTDARFGLAASLQACARHDDAIAAYEAILASEPDHPEANYGLATLLSMLGRSGEAEARFGDALAADPDFAEAGCGLGKLLMGRGAFNDAAACFSKALDVDPDYIEARLGLATCLSRLYRDDEALAAFRVVLHSQPDHLEAHVEIGTLLDRKRQHDEAIEHFRTVLAAAPGYVDALAGLATALKNTGRHAEALELARQVLASRPDYAPALSLLGSVLAEMGSIDEARALFRKSVALAPGRAEYAYYLAELGKVGPGDEVLSALEAMLPRIDSYPAQEQCLLLFALAKVYDDIGERSRGFAHLLRGNAIKRSQIEYKEAATLAGLERIARVFTPELFAARAGEGDPSTLPVFIVGMPRSGTTLVEQILASHGSVFGAGERTELPRAVGALEQSGRIGFPEAVPAMRGESLRRMGADYAAGLRSLDRNALRIVDKLPANFLLVGLIRLILPNAKIVHVSRDPVDTCLSCFSKLFSGDQPFSYDLAELGRYYRAYRRLMAHWSRVLPQECMLDIAYESLIDDFEAVARRIVAHCDLPWDPACLEFHRTSRAVHTASLVQVRQPIYRSAMGRWRPEASVLKPLLDALEASA